LIGSIVNILVTRTLFKKQGVTALRDRFLGDDSYSLFMEAAFRQLNFSKLSEDAKKYFNMILHPDKIKVAHSRDEVTFLGYKTRHGRLYRP